MKSVFNNAKFKNPIFWLSLIAMIFGFAGIDFSTLTSWDLFMDAVCSIFRNPVAIVAVLINVVGVFNDNSTPGVDSIIQSKIER